VGRREILGVKDIVFLGYQDGVVERRSRCGVT
jgi:hypothetical protein